MGKNKRKTSKGPAVAICILLVLVLCAAGVTGYYYKKAKDERLKLPALEEQLKASEDKYSELSEKNAELQEEYSYYGDMQKNIENTKSEVFELASQLEQKILNKETDYKIAYFTFDDGPYYGTYEVLDILKQYDIKATFFTTSVNGEYCYDNADVPTAPLYMEYVKGGHTIANHTFNHGIRAGLYKSVDSFMDMVEKQEEAIKEKADGYTAQIVRFPGGSATAGKLKSGISQALSEKGYAWVDWTAANGDGDGTLTEKNAVSNFEKTMGDGIEVILLHDYSPITRANLPKYIEYCNENNYICLPLFYESVAVNK